MRHRPLLSKASARSWICPICASALPTNRPIEGDAADEFNRFLDMFKQHRRTVLKLCDQPATLDQMKKLSPFYGNKLNDKMIQDIFEENMISKNLELLIRDGLVEKSNGHYQRVK